jgi:copper chaperone CopZ
MSCPDAVRAALTALPGVMAISYEPATDLFRLTYRTDKVQLATIFAAVWEAGRRNGQEFVPRLVEG